MTAQDGTHDEDARVAELGERLAGWLEELGLTSSLEAAGLPTFVRDDHGRASWTDPNTGLPLASVQLEDMERLLRRDGSEPEHAVPVGLLQLRTSTRLPNSNSAFVPTSMISVISSC